MTTLRAEDLMEAFSDNSIKAIISILVVIE